VLTELQLPADASIIDLIDNMAVMEQGGRMQRLYRTGVTPAEARGWMIAGAMDLNVLMPNCNKNIY